MSTSSSPTTSLRQRLLVSIFISLMSVLGASGLISYKVSLHEADEIFSARLATSARVLESLLAKSVSSATLSTPIVVDLPSALTNLPTDRPSSLGHPYEAKLAFQLWSEDGRMLVRSETAPPLERLGPIREGFSESNVGDKDWHVFTIRSSGVWIEVAEEIDLRVEMAEEVAWTLTSPLLAGLFFLLIVVNLTVLIGLKPLNELADKINARDPESTDPFSLNHIPSELVPVVNALNGLLIKVHEALARERRFTDAAAHELRTPLTALSVHAQNLASANTEEERAISLGQLMQGLSRTKHLAEQMLTYSRISSNTFGEESTDIDLQAELEYMVNRQRMVMEDSPLQIEMSVKLHSSPFLVRAGRGVMEILIHNVLENACKYSVSADIPVLVALSQQSATQCTLRVSNSSIDIPETELQRLFEPYHRFHSQSKVGNGLGLAMVHEIAALYGWGVDLRIEHHRQASPLFVVEVLMNASHLQV